MARSGHRAVDLATRLAEGRSADPTADGLLEAVSLAEELGREAQVQLQDAVTAARAHGVSWQNIGRTLGVSRQAAFKRFSLAADSHIGGDTDPASVDLYARTATVFSSLAAGDFDAVKALMTFTCSRQLTRRKVMGVWSELEQSAGPFELCTDLVATTLDGRTIAEKILNRHLVGGVVIQTRLVHEKQDWTGRVAYNGSGRITGLLIAPLGATDLAF
ncbi:hypothetical protein N1028_18890 [Herbiconiux sp. CPCC 203407]|uniref:DUF3887 domain-containing protein n=1 Tax=Herbiconiux oxytropis TaxID=2970915 RepID=A0AA42BUW1_9MICO|nr:hypothetical protein [Herbiconiux oxytropis]MCS5723383.1 hypothetical protein [Herbiconiux oxytropis]MCS5727970.1 hypothetical protein [Herbiconiux oxytropis]